MKMNEMVEKFIVSILNKSIGWYFKVLCSIFAILLLLSNIIIARCSYNKGKNETIYLMKVIDKSLQNYHSSINDVSIIDDTTSD